LQKPREPALLPHRKRLINFAPESSSYVRGQEKNRQPCNKRHLLRSTDRSRCLIEGICTEQERERLETTVDQALIRATHLAPSHRAETGIGRRRAAFPRGALRTFRTRARFDHSAEARTATAPFAASMAGRSRCSLSTLAISRSVSRRAPDKRHRHGGADRKGRIRYCRGCPRVLESANPLAL